MTPKRRLGEMLLDEGVIDETQLKAALGHQRKWGLRLGQALVELKLATEADVVRALSAKFGVAVADLAALDPAAQQQATRLLPREFAVRNNVLPLAADSAGVTVAMSDPSNLAVVDEIQFRAGRRVKVCIAGDREIAEAVSRSYPGGGPVEPIALDLEAEPAAAAEAVFDPFAGGGKDDLASRGGGGELAPRAPGPGPASRRAPPTPAPPAAAPSGARPPAVAEDAAEPEELTPLEEPPQGDAILASELAPPGQGPASPEERDLTPRELAMLDALDPLAGDGAPPEPAIVKPVQTMAAVIRLLLRKGIVTEEELVDELRRR